MSVARKVNIRPGVSVLSVLRHLNYSPWFALAEFVDNSLQSYIETKTKNSRNPRSRVEAQGVNRHRHLTSREDHDSGQRRRHRG